VIWTLLIATLVHDAGNEILRCHGGLRSVGFLDHAARWIVEPRYAPDNLDLAEPPPREVVASVAHGGAGRPIRQPRSPARRTLANGGLLMPEGGEADTFP
jgi:hypothetical protein